MAVDKATFDLAGPATKAVCVLEKSDTVKGTLEFVENVSMNDFQGHMSLFLPLAKWCNTSYWYYYWFN